MQSSHSGSMPDTLASCISHVQEVLEQTGNEAASQEAYIMAWYLLGASPTDIALDPGRVVDEQGRAVLEDALRRRTAGEPIQYICGRAPFRYADLICREGVFIPRPETEVLVDLALEAADTMLFSCDPGDPAFSDGILVADLCCGSGTIAVSMASERPKVRCFAGDISQDAVELARENASALGVSDKVDVRCGDLFEPFPGMAFHVVVSNPPYIPTANLAALPSEVADWEPVEALDGGEGGLDVFERIVGGCEDHLMPGGYLVCELDESTLDAARDICEGCPSVEFEDVRVEKDLAGRDRVIMARRCR